MFNVSVLHRQKLWYKLIVYANYQMGSVKAMVQGDFAVHALHEH